MKYIFTQHAKQRLKLRKIKKKEVITTINKYHLKSLEEDNVVAYYRKINKKFSLKVVAVEEKETIKIITVHPIETKRLKNVRSLIEIK